MAATEAEKRFGKARDYFITSCMLYVEYYVLCYIAICVKYSVMYESSISTSVYVCNCYFPQPAARAVSSAASATRATARRSTAQRSAAWHGQLGRGAASRAREAPSRSQTWIIIML